MKIIKYATIFLLVLAISQSVCADDVNFGKQTPTEAQVIGALKKATPEAEFASSHQGGETDEFTADIGKTRGLAIKTAPKKAMYVKPKANDVVYQSALSMEILFSYNSATLSADAKEKLIPVGKALASKELKGLKFVVEGHTDAIGGEEFNIGLSEQRAMAVKDFLVTEYSLSPSSIKVVGKGKEGLLDPSNPGSEVNRRVRIISLAE